MFKRNTDILKTTKLPLGVGVMGDINIRTVEEPAN